MNINLTNRNADDVASNLAHAYADRCLSNMTHADADIGDSGCTGLHPLQGD